MTWSPVQRDLRADWGLDELEREPSFHATVDPMQYPARNGLGERPVRPPTAVEIVEHAARFLREVPLARARLALEDPAGERDALVPLAPSRARATLRAAEVERTARARVPWTRGDRLPDGRELLSRLGADPNRGRGVVACPAHEDRRPSLSWRLADDGRALVFCHAGCTFAQILEAVR